MKKTHAPKFKTEDKFLHCSIPGCQGFAKNAANFCLHMKRKHGITIDRAVVGARQLMHVIYGKREEGLR